MPRPSQPAVSPPSLRRLWEALGLGTPDTRSDWVDWPTQIRGVTTTLPAALFAQLLAALVVVSAAIVSANTAITTWVVASAATTLAAGIVLAILLAVPPMRHWRPHRHARATVVLGAAQAAGLGSMLWAATRLPMAHGQS